MMHYHREIEPLKWHYYCNILYYIYINRLYYIVLLNLYMNKTEIFSFRTTEQNINFLKLLADADDRSQSYILNKMIDAFRKRGCFTVEQIR